MTKQPGLSPADVAAEDGEVTIDWPHDTVGSLTPEAADETARALHVAAQDAKRQRGDVQELPGAVGPVADSMAEARDRAE